MATVERAVGSRELLFRLPDLGGEDLHTLVNVNALGVSDLRVVDGDAGDVACLVLALASA